MNDKLKPLDGTLILSNGGSKCSKELLEKLSYTVHADLLCLNKSDREEILNQVGIPLDIFANGFQVKSFSNLWAIELLIINKLKRTDLAARLWAVRQKFHSQVGDDIYTKYTSSLAEGLTEEKIKTLINNEFNEQSTSKTADQKNIDYTILEEAIRGDITNITRQSQRLSYYKLLRLDSIYEVKAMTLKMLLIVLLLMAISLAVLYGFDTTTFSFKPLDKDISPQNFSLVVLTIFSGMIGSCMSLLQRTEKASGTPSNFTDSALDAMDIKNSISLIYIISLIYSGAIFATILYLLAVSGYFSVGELFPKLKMVTDVGICKEQGVLALFYCVEFDQHNALMLVWAFLAGFAERLVPDTLDSLMKKARETKP